MWVARWHAMRLPPKASTGTGKGHIDHAVERGAGEAGAYDVHLQASYPRCPATYRSLLPIRTRPSRQKERPH